jgi:apolipoprotein D and lipocalin family protein
MKSREILNILTMGIMMTSFFSCVTIPEGAEAVSPFDKERYLGKWYEIARLDSKFEKDLNNTTAEYSMNDNGTIKVVNQGYNTKKREWVKAIGKAKFAKSDSIAMLRVSFFGPFYAGYNVIALDEDYKYALIAGASLKYLWILSRETMIPEEVKVSYMKIAENIGYNTAELIWVEHDNQE